MNDMSRNEKIAWVLTFSSAAILIYLGGGLMRLVTLEDGVVTALPGLGWLMIKAVGIATLAELATDGIASFKGQNIEVDERDRMIRYRAGYYGLMALVMVAFAAAGKLLFIRIITIDTVDTLVVFAGVMVLVNIAWVIRHGTELILYRWGA